MPESDSQRPDSADSELPADDDTVDSFLRAAAGEGSHTRGELQRAAQAAGGARLAAGQVVGQRYRLEQRIGAGGMGVIWSAMHVVTRRRVALKFLKGSSQLDDGFRQRFVREARATAAVHHPSVVEILDWFELDGSVPVIVMELLHGETLAQRLAREQRLDVAQTAAVLGPVVSAVRAAHALGIVHRDLKPENIFLTRAEGSPHVKVLDFGIAKLMQPLDESGENGAATVSGATLGTPCYMAPEQALGERDLDPRVDVWALGAIAHECLAGRRAVTGANLAQVVLQLTGAGVVPLARMAPELPAELCALVDRMLARDREARPSLLEVAEALARAALNDEPAAAAKTSVGEPHANGTRTPTVAALALLGVLAMGALAVTTQDSAKSSARSKETGARTDRSALSPAPAHSPAPADSLAPAPAHSLAPAHSPAPAPAHSHSANIGTAARRARKRVAGDAPPTAVPAAPLAPAFRGGIAERVPF